jgi:uncharacterized protein (TIGR02246 family)
VRLDVRVTTLIPDVSSAVRQVIEKPAAGHQQEDVDACLAVFGPVAVWVTSRGECFRDRAALGEYLREVIAGGLGDGSVVYRVESVHAVSEHAAAVVVEQTYVGGDGEPRDAEARHTHTYVVAERDGEWLIVAGQNTVRQ